MRIMQTAMMMSAIAALVCGAIAEGPKPETGDDATPLRAASVVPEDVHLLIQIDDAAAIRAELADRPIARWIAAMVESSEFHQAWQQLAVHTGRESSDLFDRCFGRSVSVIYRRAGDGRDRDEWALITEMKADDSTDLLRRLQPRTLRSRSKFSIYELPEHDLLMARRGETMLIGPRQSPSLMLDVLSRHGRGDGIGKPLSEAEQFASVRELERGNIALFMRHQPPLGGHSAAVLRMDGEQMRLQHRARFDSPPFSRTVTRIEIDVSPLKALEDHALIAVIEPADIGMGPFESFLIAALGEGLFSPAMRENLSDRRIIVLGDIEGRQEEKQVDLLAPTITMAMEIKQANGALEEIDQHVVKLIRQLAAHGGGRFAIDVPDVDAFADAQARQVDLSPATHWFTGSLPIAQPMTLNWYVVDETESRYAVFATHPDALRDTMHSLSRTRPRAPIGGKEARSGEASTGRFQSCGTINGVRISQHLESWADRPDLFLGRAHGDSERREDVADSSRDEFQQTLKLMATFAGGIERLRWRLVRPSTHEMHLDLRLTLTAPESVRPE